MAQPTAETVRGDFSGQLLEHFDETWIFQQSGEDYFVVWREGDAEPRRFRVEMTFGVEPLQQYLVAFPDGRFQALPVAWDSRGAAEGGQRWFHLLPDEKIPNGDPLHWEGLAYNWNSQCASCHSTWVEKNYEVATDRFETRYAEIDVGCEACHGPGLRHVKAVRGGATVVSQGDLDVQFERWDPERWQRNPGARVASLARAPDPDSEMDVCAPCHSRRGEIVDRPVIGVPFLEGYRPSLLEPGLYFDDAQIHDEVYVWGSFVQSRMFEAGVRCSDCHDPHSLALRRPGNLLCEGCHSPDVFSQPTHHGHRENSEGAACVACHMPARTYMEVDSRRDHGFSVPSPARSQSLGAPSACEGCHPSREASWAEAAISSWASNPNRRSPWQDRLGGEQDHSKAWREIALAPTAPDLARASALERHVLGAVGQGEDIVSIDDLMGMRDSGGALVRRTIADLGDRLPPALRRDLLTPLLGDPVRSVRIAAAQALAEVPASAFSPSDRMRWAAAIDELKAAHRVNAERPEARANQARLAAREGKSEEAAEIYNEIIERFPYFVPAYVNLADRAREEGDAVRSVELLRGALEQDPDAAWVRYALGLAHHRKGDSESAIAELERAARTAPDEPQFVLAWALALDGSGQRDAAIVALRAARDRGTATADLCHALVALLRDRGDWTAALEAAEDWAVRFPGDARARAIKAQLGDRPES